MFRKKKKLEIPEQPLIPQSVFDEIRVRLADQITEELRDNMIITQIHNNDAISYRANVMIDSRSLRRS